jgi:hypothetical protein
MQGYYFIKIGNLSTYRISQVSKTFFFRDHRYMASLDIGGIVDLSLIKIFFIIKISGIG